jgi:hypothetical protein
MHEYTKKRAASQLKTHLQTILAPDLPDYPDPSKFQRKSEQSGA